METSKEQFSASLGNPYAKPMSDDLKLLFTYMEKEAELIKKFDKDDGIDVDAPDYKPHSVVMDRLLGFENYRKAYTESMYQNMLVMKGVARNATVTESLDRNQREAHNTALTYLLGFKQLGKVLGLEPLYKGEEVSEESIVGTHSDHSPARKEMTNFFLNLITELSEYNVLEIENEILRENAFEIKRTMQKDDHAFRVKDGGLKKYHGDIEFE